MASDPEAPISFPALVVAEVDEKQLHSDRQGRLNTSSLPIKRVTFPVPDIRKVAVLSWRWDTIRPGLSLNIFVAVRYAKRKGIEYLFIDAVSIDQHRSGNDLIQDVLSFSKLYETIPVIAAYGMPNEDFRKTLLRPWIVYELRKYIHSPYGVTYAGYYHGVQNFEDFHLFAHILKTQEKNKNWNSYTNTLLGILNGEVGMAVISDFKLLLPAYAHIIDVTYQKMSRNDYLLTLALLCQAATQPVFFVPEKQIEGEGKSERATLATSTFKRYNVVTRVQGNKHHHFDILLDGQKVARWIAPLNSGKDSANCILATMETTEYSILKALGLEDEFESFVKNEAARKECMYLGSNGDDCESVNPVGFSCDINDISF